MRPTRSTLTAVAIALTVAAPAGAAGLPPGVTLPTIPSPRAGGSGVGTAKAPVMVEGTITENRDISGTVTCADLPALHGEGHEGWTFTYASDSAGKLTLFTGRGAPKGLGVGSVAVTGHITGDGHSTTSGCSLMGPIVTGDSCDVTVKLVASVSLSGGVATVTLSAVPGQAAHVLTCLSDVGDGNDDSVTSKGHYRPAQLARLKREDVVIRAGKHHTTTQSLPPSPLMSGTETRSSSGNWRVVVGEPGKDPIANPGGPYTVQRGRTVTLNGGRSRTRRGPMARYDWKFTAGPDCDGISPKGVTMHGRTVKVVALCSVMVSLEVENADGETDTKRVMVRVTPRSGAEWRTPFRTPRTQNGGPGAPSGEPTATAVGGGEFTISIRGGLNESDCGPGEPGAAIICPKPSGSTWLGAGYRQQEVSNPGGPFGGFHYVVGPTLEVKRVEYFNADILPGSAFYTRNIGLGQDVAGFVAAVRMHEGMGNGQPGTGHSQVIRDELLKPTGDPRRVIEAVAAPTEQALRQKADAKVREIDGRIDAASNDPLPVVWTGQLAFHNPYSDTWPTGTIHVP